MDKVSIIVPCYNEEQAVELFYTEVQKVMNTIPEVVTEYIFIDDGSVDETLEKIKKMILKQNRIGCEERVKNKASFFTRPFCVTGSFEEFPVTQKALTCRWCAFAGRRMEITDFF